MMGNLWRNEKNRTEFVGLKRMVLANSRAECDSADSGTCIMPGSYSLLVQLLEARPKAHMETSRITLQLA